MSGPTSHRSKLAINPPVFFTSGALLLLFLGIGVFARDWAAEWFPRAKAAIGEHFGWFYLLAVAFFIGFALWLMASRYGKIRLGDDHERPEFSNLTWFSMLFSAGMGIGLVFYGVYEPMYHYLKPPLGTGASPEAAASALSRTYFHWGIHAWAIYVVMALGIAYFAYRRKLPLALRSCFHPILGERIHGWPGHAIDILAVFGTLFGLATSLGLGARQVSAGLNHLFGLPHTVTTQMVLILVITLAATLSLVTGVSKGIRRLSELNMTLAALLMVFVFLVGPTLYILDSLVEGIGRYPIEAISRTLRVGVGTEQESSWVQGWTVFYWAWWIAWAPFVGMFVARISRGRTIREFIFWVLLIPTAVTFIWFSVFGGTALGLERDAADIASTVVEEIDTGIYLVLERLPLSEVTSMLAAAVVAVFFVTSSDSASFVVDMLTSGGHPDPPVWQRVFWACAEGACAATLLYAGGEKALSALQAMVICVGLPFCLVLIMVCVSLVKSLRTDPMILAEEELAAKSEE